MNKEVLSLGKLLVNELGLESSVDTLSRWMAHYIAEQMKIAESSNLGEKDLAEEKCFETILKLWKHMRYYSGNLRPFENFESIFETLSRLDPDNRNTYYFQNAYSRKEFDEDDIVSRYLTLATSVDEVARVWLKFIFQSAVEAAVDEKSKEWIEAALPLQDNAEASLLVRILSFDELDDYENQKENKISYLERRVAQLEEFKAFNEDLISMYKHEINKLNDEIDE